MIIKRIVSLTLATVMLLSSNIVFAKTNHHKNYPRRVYVVVTTPEHISVNKKNFKHKINANFFSLKTNEPCGTLIVDGKKIQHNTYNRSSLVVRESGASIEIVSDSNTPKDISYAVGGGVVLLREGKTVVSANSHFTKQFINASVNRSAVGIMPDGRVALIVATNVNLYRMATIMKNLGCVEALSLDGGSSSTLYKNGRCLIQGRRVPIYITVD